MNITQLLQFAVQQGASDLHLSSGLPPMLRLDGELCRTDDLPNLSHETLHSQLSRLMNDQQRQLFSKQLDLDFAFEITGLARFRVNLFQQYRGVSAVFRVIPSQILTLTELNFSSIFQQICHYSHGLVLVTGATGSGKSTTLAAMVDYINHHRHAHILTIEDPIEFIHQSQQCLIQQRELHQHSPHIHQALRAALREDPDIILIGELRDVDTIRLALTAAETGHLVLATLHTTSAAKTIDRIIDVFSAGEKEMIRTMLSESLQAVICQTLCKKNGGGRIAAHEIMLGIPAIRHLIRENKVAQMYSTMQTSAHYGMVTLEQSLKQLINQGMIDAQIMQTFTQKNIL